MPSSTLRRWAPSPFPSPSGQFSLIRDDHPGKQMLATFYISPCTPTLASYGLCALATASCSALSRVVPQ